VPGGQFGDDAGGGGADVVHVQFGLGQSCDEGMRIAKSALVGQEVPPRNGTAGPAGAVRVIG
jgi:hypothetical protein